LPGAEKMRLKAALNTSYADGDKGHTCKNYVDLANRLADHFDVPRRVIPDTPTDG